MSKHTPGAKANARLIAAAPELLEAAKHAERLVKANEIRSLKGGAESTFGKRLRAAIAKAEGQPGKVSMRQFQGIAPELSELCRWFRG